MIAVDLQQGMLDFLRDKLRAAGETGDVLLVRGEATEKTLGDSFADVVLLANVWHELDDHRAVLTETRRILRAGGRLAILDWRSDVPNPPGPPQEHRIPDARVRQTLTANGWKHEDPIHTGSYHYLIISRPGG